MSINAIMNVTYVNGQTGPCSDKVKDAGVKYGRNAIGNHLTYLNELGFGTADATICTEQTRAYPNFSLKYLPEEKPTAENLNKMALLGAAFAELGNKMSIPVETLNKKIQQAFGPKASATSFDLNNDGQIDIAEDAVSFLMKDMASKQKPEDFIKTGKLNLSAKDIDGNITQAGEDNFNKIFLNTEKSAEIKQSVDQIYKTFKLDEAKNIFAADKNNTEV